MRVKATSTAVFRQHLFVVVCDFVGCNTTRGFFYSFCWSSLMTVKGFSMDFSGSKSLVIKLGNFDQFCFASISLFCSFAFNQLICIQDASLGGQRTFLVFIGCEIKTMLVNSSAVLFTPALPNTVGYLFYTPRLLGLSPLVFLDTSLVRVFSWRDFRLVYVVNPTRVFAQG